MSVTQHFLPGSNWLYYKIYIGEGYSNRFLVEKISPLVKNLMKKGSILYWFFIRYNDPDHHIRIRMYCGNQMSLAGIVTDFEVLCEKLLSQGYVSEVQIATYRRELSRYGEQNIEMVEKLWGYESNFILSSIKQHNNGEGHILSIIGAAHLYLQMFYSDDQQILKHVQNNFLLYAKEFMLKKNEKRTLSKKFRGIHEKINNLLSPIQQNNTESHLYLSYRTQLKPIANGLNTKTIPNLYASLLHMLVNRGFDKSQREMEMVIYHHLWKYYQSRIARFGKL